MKTYAGIDLHSRNNYIGIIDGKDRRLYSKRHDNRIEDILKVLGQFKASLQGVVVESTYNWYWLVDGLMDAAAYAQFVESAGTPVGVSMEPRPSDYLRCASRISLRPTTESSLMREHRTSESQRTRGPH